MIPVGWIVLFSYKKRKLRFGFLLRDALLVIQLGFKIRQADSRPSLFTSIPYCHYSSFIKSMSRKTSGVISQPSNIFEELRAVFHGSEKKCHAVVLKSLSCEWQAGRDNRPLSVAPRRELRKWTTDGDLLLFLPKFQFIT